MAKPRKGVNRTLPTARLKLWADEVFFAAVRSGNLEWSAWPMIFKRLDILINIKETSCNILDRCSVICDSDLQL